MSIATLDQFKGFIREIADDLDLTFQLALQSATAEANAEVGFDIESELIPVPSDIVMACLLLAQTHVDAGSVEENVYRRAAASSLLRPYRTTTGMASA